ncbi:MAG: hypothetical protein O7C59_01820 [Rickettsia endosymbiont of Ixodes persulcatus]|nr:hypothetical protein [Rickettsia endosymbiont of Ixodes persulcatus]
MKYHQKRFHRQGSPPMNENPDTKVGWPNEQQQLSTIYVPKNAQLNTQICTNYPKIEQPE